MLSRFSPFNYETLLCSESPLQGREASLNNGRNKCYITGTNTDRILLYIHDIKGWTNKNARRLADLYAEQVDATVYIPDFFAGEVPPQTHPQLLNFGIGSFLSRNTKDMRRPEIFACTEELRQSYPSAKLGVVGFCFGGWSGLELGSRNHSTTPPSPPPVTSAQSGTSQCLIDCLCIAHPALVTEDDLRNVAVPTLIIAPEQDNPFNPDLKRFANETIPANGVPYCYAFFPGVEHRFASQPDVESVEGGEAVQALWKRSFERAQMQIVNWLNVFI